MKLNRIIISAFATLFLILTGSAGVVVVRAHQELAELHRQEAANQKRLQDAEQLLQEQERHLAMLTDNRDCIERTIRRKLGYARPDEVFFRFDN